MTTGPDYTGSSTEDLIEGAEAACAATTGAPAPLPWRVHRFGPWEAVVDANDRPLFGLMTVPEPNWHFICLAVNQHHALVAALEWAERQISALVTEDDGSGTFIRGTGTELSGFCIGRDAMRAVLARCEPRAQP